jgi:hypothetical protein
MIEDQLFSTLKDTPSGRYELFIDRDESDDE